MIRILTVCTCAMVTVLLLSSNASAQCVVDGYGVAYSAPGISFGGYAPSYYAPSYSYAPNYAPSYGYTSSYYAPSYAYASNYYAPSYAYASNYYAPSYGYGSGYGSGYGYGYGYGGYNPGGIGGPWSGLGVRPGLGLGGVGLRR